MSERSERDTIRGVQIRAGAVYIYIYMYGGTYALIVGMPRIRIVGGLGHCHVLYVLAVLNVVTTGNGTGTKMF